MKIIIIVLALIFAPTFIPAQSEDASDQAMALLEGLAPRLEAGSCQYHMDRWQNYYDRYNDAWERWARCNNSYDCMIYSETMDDMQQGMEDQWNEYVEHGC